MTLHRNTLHFGLLLVALAAVRGKANASWSLTFPESETPAGLVVSLIWAGRNEARINASSGGGAILSPTLNEKGALRWHRTTFATTGSGPVRFSIDHSVCIHRIVVRGVQPYHPVSTCEAENAAASPANGSPAAAQTAEERGKGGPDGVVSKITGASTANWNPQFDPRVRQDPFMHPGTGGVSNSQLRK